VAYASTQNLKDWIGSNVSSTNPGLYQQLTDRVSATTESGTVGTMALDRAEGVIDAKLSSPRANYGKGYKVPVDVSSSSILSAFLVGLNCDIAGYYLFGGHGMRETIPERIVKAFDAAMEMLEDIAEGDAMLPTDSALAGATQAGASLRYGAEARQFSETAREWW